MVHVLGRKASTFVFSNPRHNYILLEIVFHAIMESEQGVGLI